MPLFSLIYFLLSWAFIVCFIVFIFYHYQKKSYQSNNLSGYSALGQNDDDDQDEDLQAFINKGLSNTLYGANSQEEEENDDFKRKRKKKENLIYLNKPEQQRISRRRK